MLTDFSDDTRAVMTAVAARTAAASGDSLSGNWELQSRGSLLI